MDDYVILTVTGRPGEADAAFKGRLTAFWTHVLRTRPDDYEGVYAEATRFGRADDAPSRQYFVSPDALDVILAELTETGVGHEPPDRDDLYSKYEAASPDWFQIDH
ncbi:MAG TPA: hypothetical protein VD866_05695 [Urbifossiella sp.]|nr:hypothetical protein [Urbifossiella sp.]